MPPRTRFDRILTSTGGHEPAKHTEVFTSYLVQGRDYLYNGKRYEFSGMGQTGKAIIHPPGEPDMQSSLAVDPRELTPCPTS